MPRLNFEAYAPDQANFDSSALSVAQNTVPTDGGYAPFKGVARSGGRLEDEIRGVIDHKHGSTRERFVGTLTKLWRWNPATEVYDDVSRTVGGDYSLTDSDFWSFEAFGDYILAFNGQDDPQKFDLDGGTNFEALGGPPPVGVSICEHKDFIFTFRTLNNGTVEVEWSGVADAEIWDGTSLSDVQPLPAGGPGRAIVNAGDAVFFWQAYKCHRFVYTSNPEFIFARDEIEPGRGCVGSKAVAAAGGAAFFVAEDGIYSINAGGAVDPIGAGWVNEYFFSRVAPNDLQLVLVVADPRYTRIYFLYRSASAGVALFDEMLIYDWRLRKWSLAVQDIRWLFPSATDDVTLEDLGDMFGNLEDIPGSLSDRRWQGGDGILGVFDGEGYFGSMTGDNAEAVFETADYLDKADVRKMVARAMAVVDAPNWTMQIGTRERLTDAVQWSAARSPNVTGWARFRNAGRTIRFRVTIPEGETWTKAQGVEMEIAPTFAPKR